LEYYLFPTDIGEEDEDVAAFDTVYSSNISKKTDIKNNNKSNNFQRNESLDKYQSLVRVLVVLMLPCICSK
jgi:hypothetical protein